MSENLVTIASFPDSIQAHLARQHLESSGIKAVIYGENLADTNFLGVATGGVRILVARDDAIRAVAALQARFDEPEPVRSDSITTSGDGFESYDPYADLPEEDEVEEEERARGLKYDPDEFSVESARSQKIDRAFKATLFGILFCPIFLYSWWLLFDVLTTDEPISPRARNRLRLTLVLQATLVVLVVLASLYEILLPVD